MNWGLIGTALLSFSFAAIALWVGYSRSKTKSNQRSPAFEREEFQINPADVPEFRPTWRNAR